MSARGSTLVALGALLVPLAACGESEVQGADEIEDAGERIGQGIGEGLEGLRSMTEEGWNDLKAATADGRERVEARLSELSADVDRSLDGVEQRARNATGAAATEVQSELSELRREASTLDDELAELREAGADRWSSLRDAIVTRMRSLRERIDALDERAGG